MVFCEDGRSVSVFPEGKDMKSFTFDQVFSPVAKQEVATEKAPDS